MLEPVTIEIVIPKHVDLMHDMLVVPQQCCKEENDEEEEEGDHDDHDNSESESDNCDENPSEVKEEHDDAECEEAQEVCEETESESECGEPNSEADSESETDCVKIAIPPFACFAPVARFYGLTLGRKNTSATDDRESTDYNTAIVPGGSVAFPRVDFESGGISHDLQNLHTIVLAEKGLYRIEWIVQTNEQGQLQIAVQTPPNLNFVPLVASTSIISNVIVGNAFVQTTVANSKIQLINPMENQRSLTVHNEQDSAWWARAQSLLFTRLR